MKKLLGILPLAALFALLLGCSAQSPSQDTSSSETHNHSFNEQYEHDAEYHWRSCHGCDEVTDKEKHTFSETSTPATFEEGGFITHVCIVCGYSYVDGETEKLDHNYDSAWACDEQSHWHPCVDEGYEELKGDEGSHLFENWIVDEEATEYATGSRHAICEVCGYQTTEVIPLLEHVHKAGTPITENEEEPTCTRKGHFDLVTYCYECGAEMQREHKETEALGHDFTHFEAKAATCTEDGWEEYDVCSRCEYSTKNVIPATGHSWSQPTYTWSDDYSTCTASMDCENDPSHVETETVDTVYSVVKKPGYGSPGTGRYTAKFANAEFGTKFLEIIIEALDPVEYRLNDDGVSYGALAASQSISGHVSIAPMHNGLPVTQVRDGGFMSCKSLTSIVIPEGVTTIGMMAFGDCASLTSVEIPRSLTYLYRDAFYNCPSQLFN